MAKEFAKPFYNSKKWLKIRKQKINMELGLCEICKHPGYIVHHKIHITPENVNDPNITINPNNLQYLCLQCHNKVHGVYAKNEPIREIKFDCNGNVIGVIDTSVRD